MRLEWRKDHGSEMNNSHQRAEHHVVGRAFCPLGKNPAAGKTTAPALVIVMKPAVSAVLERCGNSIRVAIEARGYTRCYLAKIETRFPAGICD